MYQLWNYAQLLFIFFKENIFFAKWVELGSKQYKLISQTLFLLFFARDWNTRDISRHRLDNGLKIHFNLSNLVKFIIGLCSLNLWSIRYSQQRDQVSSERRQS